MEILLVLSGGVNRLTEVIKAAFITNANLSDEVKRALNILISLLLGVVAIFGAGLTLGQVFPDNPLFASVPVFAGQIALGLLVGAGAGAIHAIMDFFQTIQGRVEPPMVTALSGRKATIARVQTDTEAVG